jgi:hypothetical protein
VSESVVATEAATATSRKRNGKSNIAPAKLPIPSTNDQGNEHGCD